MRFVPIAAAAVSMRALSRPLMNHCRTFLVKGARDRVADAGAAAGDDGILPFMPKSISASLAKNCAGSRWGVSPRPRSTTQPSSRQGRCGNRFGVLPGFPPKANAADKVRPEHL